MSGSPSPRRGSHARAYERSVLAEVDIPYDKLKELDESNNLLNDCDIAIILGANDVVNPLARTAKDTPIRHRYTSSTAGCASCWKYRTENIR